MDLAPPVRRAMNLYAATYALAWFNVALLAGPGSVALVDLSGHLEWSGGYTAVYWVGAALGAFLGGRAMHRWGRVPVSSAAHATSAVGLLVAGLAVHLGHLPLFVVGTVQYAFGIGSIFLTRGAVAELVPAVARGRAVARLQLAAGAGAIAGPLLLVVSKPLAAATGWDPWQAVWWVGPPLLALAAFLVTRVPREARLPPATGPRRARSAGPTARTPFLVGILGLSFAQAAMTMAMGVSGATLVHLGHGLQALGGVMAAHYVGMFALSPVIGRFADAWGRRRTILLGVSVMAGGGGLLVGTSGLLPFAAALFLVGLGWSFAFIASTVVVADVAPLGGSGRLLGTADLVTASLAILASLTGGAMFADQGQAGLGLLAIGLVAVPALAALFLVERAPGRYGAAEPVPVPA